ncbi:helix-turn-helix transcriptional regulator [Aliihoeflea sp. 2WW]|uniref:helix-turn-helix domain-containing protein n=1 Tax=Aliihoeflea sp. 2WW TaxID=1381123 RepID=UPI000463E04E|nr:helix-turn-helix transcriptional regulator [Aliihoeflea sp. 2WW]
MTSPTQSWPHLIRELMAAQNMSERGLSARAGVNRATLRRFLKGSGPLNVIKLECVLDVFGYELHLFKRPDSEGA